MPSVEQRAFFVVLFLAAVFVYAYRKVKKEVSKVKGRTRDTYIN